MNKIEAMSIDKSLKERTLEQLNFLEDPRRQGACRKDFPVEVITSA